MPLQLDLITRVRNIHWATGKFSFVSGASPMRDDYWGVSAVSDNGTAWTNVNHHVLIPKSDNESTGLSSSVRGKLLRDGVMIDAVMAGGAAEFAYEDSVGNPISKFVPIVAISTNNGTNWTDTELPFVPPDSFSPPESYPAATVFGVGYNKQQQKFFAAWQKPRDDGVAVVIEDVVYSYTSSEWIDAGTAYPAKTIVCDGRAGLGTGLVFGSSQQPDQVIKAGGRLIALSGDNDGILIDGVLISVGGVSQPQCVAAGRGAITVGGFDDDGNSVQAASFNNGASWAPIPELTSIYADGQGGGFAPVFTCS